MKRFTVFIGMALFLLTAGALHAQFHFSIPKEASDSNYNWTADGETKMINLSVIGETPYGRVSLWAGKKSKNATPIKIEEKNNAKEDDSKGKGKAKGKTKKKEKIPEIYAKMTRWGAEESRAFCLFSSTPLRKEWTKYIYSFIPRWSGRVRLTISSQGSHTLKKKFPNLHYIYFAHADADASEIQNPIFDRDLKSWDFTEEKDSRRSKIQPELIRDASVPGGKAIKTCTSLSQFIPVTKDKEVTITIYAKAGEIFRIK